MDQRWSSLPTGCRPVSDRLQRQTTPHSAPKTVSDDQTVIQWLREQRGVVHVEATEQADSFYVKAPATTESIVHTFPLLTHDGEDWQRTSIDALTLTRVLRERSYRLVHEAQTPFANDND